jgi:CRP/FNR family transcriptional regulator
MRAGATSKADEVLSAVGYFAGLDETALEGLAQAAIRREYTAGQVIFLEGEACAGLYIVQAGWLKSVKMSPDGREQVVRVVGPGEVFNEVSVLVGSPNLVTVIALEPTKAWVVEREAMLHWLDEHPRLARIIAQHLAERALYLLSLVEDLSLRTVEARLARLLLEQSRGGTVQRRRWATQSEMAARLGTVPDVINRALRSLVEEGLIQVERHQIQVLDRQGLEAKAMLEG